MIRNYFKIAWRNLNRSRSFSVINIGGLAMGMAASILVFLWIQDELSIGRHHENLESLYRIMGREVTDGKIVVDTNTPGLLADELKREFPEVLYAAGFSNSESHLLAVGEKTTRHTGNFAGADWFNLYGLKLLAGSPDALASPGSIAISRSLAENYFGSAQQAAGQSMLMDNRTNLMVKAVFEDPPAASLDQYDYLLNWDDYLRRESWLTKWSNYGPETRVRLRASAKGLPVDPAPVSERLKWFMKSRDDFSPTYHVNLFLKAEKDVYLYSRYKDGYEDGGRITYVRAMGVIAVFLILIAAINFMNLSTARSAKRLLEVGVRKAVGAGRTSLIGQFMSEATLLIILAIAMAITAVAALLPAFNQSTGKQLHLPFESPVFYAYLIGLLLVTALLSGAYPAFFLSAFKPSAILKNAMPSNPRARLLRRGLVVFQFALSMTMMVAMVVIYRQLQYIRTKDIGYDRQNLIQLRIEGELANQYDVFKESLLQNPAILSVTHLYTNPLENNNTTEGVSWPGKDPNASISFNNTAVGLDFVKTMDLTLMSGRDFSRDFGTDSAGYLINEAAARRIGYDDPLGQPLTFWEKTGKIIGIVRDFHFNSLYDPIHPMIIRLADGHYGNILIRTQPGQAKAALADVESLYSALNPEFPFVYSFVDVGYDKFYQNEEMVGKLLSIFTGLAIFIACLGLLGLAAFTAEQRTKEIGIRKVLGASVSSIVTLLSKDFIKLVVAAVFIASPVAWLVMNKWLEHFAYRIDIQWWMFAVAGLAAVVIALATVGWQAVRAAVANPVESLRTE